MLPREAPAERDLLVGGGVQDVGEIAKVALPKGKGGTAYLAFNTPEVLISTLYNHTFTCMNGFCPLFSFAGARTIDPCGWLPC